MINAFRFWNKRSSLEDNYPDNTQVLSNIYHKLDYLRHRPSSEFSLKTNRFVVFDTETTGFSFKKGDEIISIGAVAVENGEVTDTYFSELVNPHRNIPEVITKLTGISNEMVVDSPDILTALDQFLDFKGISPLVAHNASFDLNFINHKLRKYCGQRLNTTSIDTFVVSRFLRPLEECHSLDCLAHDYDVPLTGRHTALGDSLITAQIFTDMIKKLVAGGIKTTYQLASYLQLKRLI